ncbi:MAG: hypothetical protein J5506_00540 [Prevotella sp.]|nr:hypothetical protein [Prevotella sp.]
MNVNRRRILSARLLLAVFVGMLALSSLHHHEHAAQVGDNCYNCHHHLPHAGHLSGASASFHQCVLCQFQSLPYVQPGVVLLSAPSFCLHERTGMVCAMLFGSHAFIHSTRAPPSLLLL